MLDLESPPLRTVRTLHQEKRLRKRRELDALVRESGGRRRRTGGREELLYGEEETSSDDSGPGRTHEAGGVTVWRPSHQVRRRGVVWLGVRWGLAMGLVIFMGSLSVWLHLHTRTEIEAVRRQLARGEATSQCPSLLTLTPSVFQCPISMKTCPTLCYTYRPGWRVWRPTSPRSSSASTRSSSRFPSWRRSYRFSGLFSNYFHRSLLQMQIKFGF